MVVFVLYLKFSVLLPPGHHGQSAESLADYDFFLWWQADLDTWHADPPGALMGLGERAKPSNSSVSTTRIRPLSGPHWPWMLLQALSALRSGPRLQHLVQLHIRTDCGPQGHQLKNPSTVVHAQFARLQLSQWDRHRGTQCASVRWSSARCALSPSHCIGMCEI